jgi:cysteinyl-tRNA synthetase
MAQRLLEALAAPGGSGVPVPVARYVSEFEAAMDDNLATDRALAVLDGMARDIQHAAAAERDLSVAQATLRRLCAVFGLRLDGDIEPRVQQGWDLHYQRFV